MNVRRRKDTIQKGLKDYLVPIIGGLLIIVLIFSFFSGSNEPTQIDLENKVGLELTMDSPSTESYIEYPGNFKKKIEGDISLYKGEKVIVKEGSVSLALFGSGDFKVDKLGELKYLENGDFSILSSNLWLNSTLGVNLQMRFADVKVGENTHISFSQNEMGSTVYLINGFAEVTNLAGESTVLDNGQKITVSRLDANSEDLDMSLLKENIDDYYKRSDWFIKNNGNSYLGLNEDDDKTGTGSTKTISTGNKLLNFTNLSDEANVSSDTIDVSGNFTDEYITKIVLNGTEAKINTESKTFKIENVSVANKENDLVFKVYDDSNDLLSKFIYVVYYNGGSDTNTSTSKFSVKTFDVDGSQFIFTTLKDSGVSKQLNGKTTYSTYGDYLTIYGKVTAEGIKNVSVNGYTLKSFNGSTWRYHPSVVNDNLSVGTNVYEIKYYSEAGKVVYTNHFTIIKKKIEEKETKVISDEVKVD